MAQNTTSHHETLHEAKIEPPSEFSTGIVFACVAAIVAAIFRHSPEVWIAALTAAGGFAGLAYVAPKVLRPLNIAWFRFALLLNRFVSPIIMGIIFVIAIIPFGLIMQLRHDPLRRARAADADSYWIKRPERNVGASMRDQF